VSECPDEPIDLRFLDPTEEGAGATFVDSLDGASIFFVGAANATSSSIVVMGGRETASSCLSLSLNSSSDWAPSGSDSCGYNKQTCSKKVVTHSHTLSSVECLMSRSRPVSREEALFEHADLSYTGLLSNKS
jgi:hypothetical protein